MRDARFSRSGLLVAVLVYGGIKVAAAQIPAGQRPPATIAGDVVDTLGEPVTGAEMLVVADDSTVVREGISDTAGRFLLRGIPAGGPYLIMARKVGYRAARGRGITLEAGATRRFRLVLAPLAVTLDSITVKARRNRYAIMAAEFDPKVHRDALDLLAWKRPDMLGDPASCALPDTVFGGASRDDLARIHVNDRLTLFNGSAPAGASPSKRPWIEDIRFHAAFPEDVQLPYVRRLYVNEYRVDVQYDPLRSPARLLAGIPLRYIERMRYVDCWDTSVPIDQQYALFVTLTPLPADSLREVARALVLSSPLLLVPGTERTLLMKRPSREAWDSLLRQLPGRDSVAAERP